MQLMRFAVYFGLAFAGANASQFPSVKLFRESPVAMVSNETSLLESMQISYYTLFDT